ncbi:heparinase II/III domain-containing protein [Sinomicrobium sp.]
MKCFKKIITYCCIFFYVLASYGFQDAKGSETVDFAAKYIKEWEKVIPENYKNVVSRIRKEHPRVYINKDMLNDIRSRARHKYHRHFQRTKKRIDTLLKLPVLFKDSTITDGSQSKDHEYGYAASDGALLYLITGEQKYLDYTKRVLRALAGYYTFRNEQKLNVHWRANSRISALSAYDWIFDELSKKERIEIGLPLLKAIRVMVPDGSRKPFIRDNWGDYKGGYYGPPSLAWYAGLVFYKAGIDDRLAEELLKKGFEDYWKLLEYRKALAGDDGGASSAVMEYAIKAYPWAEFNFFHTVQSATGIDLSKQFTYPIDFLYYLVWNWLPGKRHFGYGDVDHVSNKLPLRDMYMHSRQLEYFYKEDHPEMMPYINWIATQVRPQNFDIIPFTRYLLPNYNDGLAARGKEYHLPELPLAMNFENMGQVFMRSGSEEDDTYVMFAAGGVMDNHRHYDNNNFVIYKNGYRTVDSGTRPEPGQHLTHYYCRSVAHNCVLIRMPGERFPKYWGGPASTETPKPIPNDGGQRVKLGSELIGYSYDKNYVYTASDATVAYHQKKASEVIRQFVFIKPDVFVVFDRVGAKVADYPKTWLLHTASEPVIDQSGKEFSEGGDGGKLFCRTIFPADAQLTKIGGPGKQFWSDGQNWPLPVLTPEDWSYPKNSKQKSWENKPLLGQWRMEISPGKARLHDSFLHLIQVGDTALHKMVSSKSITAKNRKGVSFNYRGKDYEIMFTETGTVGGSIRISKQGKTIADEEFTTTVAPQQSLLYTDLKKN